MNGAGVLQYVLLEGRKRILADSLVSVYLGDPLLAKKKCKKALDQRQKSYPTARAWGPQQYFDMDKKHWEFMVEQTRDKRTRQNPLVIPVRTRTRAKVEVAKTTIRKKSENV